MSYVEIRNLSKRFGDNTVLDGVDLNIENGKVVVNDIAKNIFENPKNPRLRQFLLNSNVIDNIEYSI